MNIKNMALTLSLISSLGLICVLGFGSAALAEISRDPNGVNVNSQGATSVFITFGGLDQQVPVEALWCGELIPATPDIGFKCDPATLLGRLPLRFDQSSLRETVFTDIMSIPPSVSRRAYQAAARGEPSSFFYVRRFQSLAGGPDEYVFVTCRLAGGGARVPFSLLDVEVSFAVDDPLLSLPRGTTLPTLSAQITYNGTGRLQGRWEVVRPSDEPPTARDLLTEASLPPEERLLQRRYTLIDRFNVFLPPTGRASIPGPRPELLPTDADGLYRILFRVEASDDKEADSNLANAGAGFGVVHSGGVAGFPMPTLRYYVGSGDDATAVLVGEELSLVEPIAGRSGWSVGPLDFTWTSAPGVVLYRLETRVPNGEVVHAAVVQQGIGLYRAPSFLADLGKSGLEWRVLALGADGEELVATPWRPLGEP